MPFQTHDSTTAFHQFKANVTTGTINANMVTGSRLLESARAQMLSRSSTRGGKQGDGSVSGEGGSPCTGGGLSPMQQAPPKLVIPSPPSRGVRTGGSSTARKGRGSNGFGDGDGDDVDDFMDGDDRNCSGGGSLLMGATSRSGRGSKTPRGTASAMSSSPRALQSPTNSGKKKNKEKPSSLSDYQKKHMSVERCHQLATTTAIRYKKGEKVPTRCGIEDLEGWFDELQYDPKKNTRQMRELIADERRKAATARRRASHGSMERRLHTLSSALRTDLEVFVNYLLDFGSRSHLSQLTNDKSAVPTRETYLQLKILFEVLDTDKSGTLTFNELQHAAMVLGREGYDRAAFHRLDNNKSGSIDFLEMIKAFYPHVPMRQITKLHNAVEKTLPPSGHLTARDFLSPGAVVEIEESFRRYEKLPGGCNLTNMLKLSSKYLQDHPEIIQTIFTTYDRDQNTSLDLEEFLEVAKFAYPPFTHSPPGGAQKQNADDSPFSLRFLTKKNLVDPRKMKVPQLPQLTPRGVTKGGGANGLLEDDAIDPTGRRQPGPDGISPRNMELLHWYSAMTAPAPSSTPWRSPDAMSPTRATTAASTSVGESSPSPRLQHPSDGDGLSPPRTSHRRSISGHHEAHKLLAEEGPALGGQGNDVKVPTKSDEERVAEQKVAALYDRIKRGNYTEVVKPDSVASMFPFSGSPSTTMFLGEGGDITMDEMIPYGEVLCTSAMSQRSGGVGSRNGRLSHQRKRLLHQQQDDENSTKK